MKQFILAAAQTCPAEQDIPANLKDHFRYVEEAANQGAGLILFPEMSLTGYQRNVPPDFLFTPEDPRLAELKVQSADHHMVIIAGAPVKIDSKVYIGLLIIYPDGALSLYTKQYLHPGEEIFFQNSPDYNPLLKIKHERISLAICADIEHRKHPIQAKKMGSTIYAASIFYSIHGISKAHQLLSQYAKENSMMILMSNYCGNVWDQEAGGGSAAWDRNGKRIAGIDNCHPGLLIIRRKRDNWSGIALKLD